MGGGPCGSGELHITETDGAQPVAARWVLDGLRYEGLVWGPQDGRPVLALHGWMDHAASFQALAPRLTGCRVVAPDLSGHGLSSHRSADASYNLWDDLPQIAQLTDQLGWNDFVLLGHSRGANIGALLAAAQPHRVRAFIALDALVPVPVQAEDVPATLRSFIEQTTRQKAKPPRLYASQEAYVARRVGQGNSRRTAQALADRALSEETDGLRLRSDPRLFASSAVKLSLPQVEGILRGLTMPVLNIWAQDGIRAQRDWGARIEPLARSLVPDYTALELPGDHHFHLEPQAATEIARAVLGFLKRFTFNQRHQ